MKNEMNKQNSELQFWNNLHAEHFNYYKFRTQDGLNKIKYFDDLKDRNGKGIDVGCGLVSILESFYNDIVAIDPLMDEYNKILTVHGRNEYLNMSGEDIKFDDEHFDYAICINVIDHTPNPKKMAEEIKRVVKKGGKIYFQVNFDDKLGIEHYDLWNEEMVNEVFGDLNLIYKKIDRNEPDKQYLYYAIYENISDNANI